jgi:hypothetical protein
MFAESFRDKQIRTSMYRCIRYMVKKRQHPKAESDYIPEDKLYGPLATLDGVISYKKDVK